MSRIRDEFLDCVIYLYPSVLAAEGGESAGGTGFLVGMPSEVYEDECSIYAVTNRYVLHEGNSPVVRLNTEDGRIDILHLDFADWYEHPDGHDLAICPIQVHDEHHVQAVGPEWFLTPEIIEQYNIGPGDDVFMTGRFVTHEGRQKNLPSARFGNIAMMPLEPILNSRGHLQESFVVEMRSISGFSGSPVFVDIPALTERWDEKKSQQYWEGAGPWLLGVDWGHLPIYEPVRDKYDKEHPDGWRVRSNSGMVGVVPAWRLLELLSIKELVMERRKNDRRLAEEKRRHPPAVFDVKEQGMDRTDFETALKKVSRRAPKPSPPDEASSET